MRPFFKTWLTICLLLPLAAHATNREQSLPAGFSGHTAKTGTNEQHSTKNRSEAKNTREATDTPVVANIATPALPSAPKRHKGRKTSATTVAAASAHGSTKQSDAVLSRAVKALGKPYVWGGSSPSRGFDCSGLVKYAFNDVHAADLPRTSNAMSQSHGQKIDRKDLKPGDLLFFNIESRRVNHVAIYLGNNRFIHAPRSGKTVTIDTLNKPYWQSHYALAKRVLPKDHSTKHGPTLRLASAGNTETR